MSEPTILRKGPHHRLVVDGLVAAPTEVDRTDGPVAPMVAAARPAEGADHATVHSGDGLFHASIPLSLLETATLDGGRLAIDDSPTRCWLVKDVVRIELTAGRQPDSLPDEERAKTER